MPDDTPTYPPDAGAATYLLTVRGTTVASTLDEARATHNSTAGAPQSAAGARSLGDLSHMVYVPTGQEGAAGEFWAEDERLERGDDRVAPENRHEPRHTGGGQLIEAVRSAITRAAKHFREESCRPKCHSGARQAAGC